MDSPGHLPALGWWAPCVLHPKRQSLPEVVGKTGVGCSSWGLNDAPAHPLQVLDGSYCCPRAGEGLQPPSHGQGSCCPHPPPGRGLLGGWSRAGTPLTQPWSPVEGWTGTMCSAEMTFLSLSPLTHPTATSHRFIYCSPRRRNSRVESPCPVPGPSSGSWAGICQSSRIFPCSHPWGFSDWGFAFCGSPPCCSPGLALLWELLTHSTRPWKGHSASRVCCSFPAQPLGMCALLLWECRGAEGAPQQS